MPAPTAAALFWFFYMAGMGIVFPLQSLYFHENVGLAGSQVGLVLAIRPLIGGVAQPFWGYCADRSGARGRVLAILAAGTALAYALLPGARSFAPLLAAVALAALFSTSVIPMASAVSMAALGSQAPRRFGRLRMWGTVGFLCLVVSFPLLLERWQSVRGLVATSDGPSEPGLELMFYAAALLSLAAAPLAWLLPRDGGLSLRSRRGDLALLLRHRPYRRLLLFTFCAFGLLQGPILLFPIFVRAHGGSLQTVSTMWIPMLLVEIPLLLLTGRVLLRIGARGLLAAGVLADGLRWTGCVLTEDLRIILALQLLHGAVVAGLIVGGQLYVEAVVPERLRATGQALVAMVGASLGGGVSSLGAGWLLERFGADAPYALGGGAALLLGLAATWILPRPQRLEAESEASEPAPTRPPR